MSATSEEINETTGISGGVGNVLQAANAKMTHNAKKAALIFDLILLIFISPVFKYSG